MDAVFALVPTDQWLARPVPERHRLLFYVGHVDAFDWNLFKSALNVPDHQESLDNLFAFGIDPKHGNMPEDRPLDWPSIEEIRQYTIAVRRKIDEILHDVSPILIQMAVEHRLMHLETFTCLLHNLPVLLPSPFLCKPVPSPFLSPISLDETMVSIPFGTATLGQPRAAEWEAADGRFGWDNEFDIHKVSVSAFDIHKYKVTNARYLKFVEAGANPPHFWRRIGKTWFWRSMRGIIPLSAEWPVYVTHQEATAYAQWKGHSLPTEAQFHRAAYGTPDGNERRYPWGDQPPTLSNGNFEGRRWDPVEVASTPKGDSAFGAAQLVGNGWEWTSTVFAPFSGFQKHVSYPGYSTPFFDGEHYILKGASPMTNARFLRRSFRNWFRSQYPYVYASFRCVAL